jgi:serine/threonine protein kinase
VAGKYLVERAIAAGGMGLVFSAKHIELDQAVALKFMRAELRGQISASRFQLEARATAKLRSSHVARVYDVGVLEDGTPFMVMELLDGIDLENLLDERGRLSADIAAELVTQACEAVSEAHNAGIIHRDLKPANLFLSKTPQGAPFVKVLDFGISKATKDTVSSATAAGMIIGSPPYMSPETLKSSRNANAQSDIWSLGIILYELVTGSLPFEGEGIGDIALKVHHEEPPWPIDIDPNIPAAFDAIVRNCMQKNAAKRYQTVAELRAALVAFSSSRMTGSLTLSLRTSHPHIVIVDDRAASSSKPPPTPRSAARVAMARAATTVIPQMGAAESDRPVQAPVRSVPPSKNPKLLFAAGGVGASIAAALAIVITSRSAVPPAAAASSPESVAISSVTRPPQFVPVQITDTAPSLPAVNPAPPPLATTTTTTTTTPFVRSQPRTAKVAIKDATLAASAVAPPPPPPAATLTVALPPVQPIASPAPTSSGRAIRDRGF